MLHLVGQDQSPHKVGEVVSQGVKLEPSLVVAKLAARQPRPLDGVLAFLDPLLRGAALIVEGHHPFRWSAQVGDDEADAGVQFARMPFDLGDHTTFLVPRTGLIAEAGVVAANMVRRATDGTGEQVSDAFLKNRVGLEMDSISVAFGFQELIDVR